MKYDTEAIKQANDLRDHAARYTTLRKESHKEMSGPCPRCGGHDRFHCKADMFFCRQCYDLGNGKAHDIFGFYEWLEGWDFLTTCEALGAPRETLAARRITGPSQTQKGLQYPVSPSLSNPIPPLPPIENNGPPCETWQNRGREFVAYARAQLWDDVGEQALAYLCNRGLSNDTIRHFGLGYNPANLQDKPNRWGLCGKKVWLAKGIVIPCEVAGALWYIKIRRPAGRPKYIQPRGSRTALFNADSLGNPDRLLLLCEGEFDAMLAIQEAGDILDVATLGSASRGIEGRWLPYLLPYKRVLAAYDQDAPGQKGLAKLSQASRRILRINFANGGDLTDYYRAGGDLRGLLASEVEKHTPISLSSDPLIEFAESRGGVVAEVLSL